MMGEVVKEMGLVKGFGRDKKRIKKPAGENDLAGEVRITDFYTGKGRKKSNNLTKKERGK